MNPTLPNSFQHREVVKGGELGKKGLMVRRGGKN